MKTLQAIGISPGIAIGPVFQYAKDDIRIEPCSCVDPAAEIARLDEALKAAHVDLERLYGKASRDTSQQDADIFEAHIMLLEDPEIYDRVINRITNEMYTAEYAWYQTLNENEQMIASLNDAYLSERSADIRDVSQRVLRILLGKSVDPMLIRPSIIIANDLSPSDTVGFDKSMALAFCTIKGGPTSHVAILSKALGIPAVIGIGEWFAEITSSKQMVLDGLKGTLVLDPDDETVQKYVRLSIEYKQSFQKAFLKARLPARTSDGHQVEIAANIGSPAEASTAVEFGAEGVGLLRTEFLFLDRELPPDEEEQIGIYREILAKFGSMPVVARTFDIGGDKPAPYLKISPELNPFLGVRGTRLALQHREIFHTQLRALLRSGVGHQLKIMFPMVGSLQEVLDVKRNVEECKTQIREKEQNFPENIEIGIMVEVPSAALIADILAMHVDFFSIGTNDLTQYTLAADRTNPLVADKADALDPAVLRLIQMVIQSAHARGKWVGLCGELAGESIAAPILLGLGLDEFSMNARSIPLVKQAIREISLTQAQEIADVAIGLSSGMEIRKYVETKRMQRS